MQIIDKYFPTLTPEQHRQLAALDALYREWNQKINVISRKDIDHLYEHHVLHSLAIAKDFTFRAGTSILDFGCGGGFPGIPLAIMFPECKFKDRKSTRLNSSHANISYAVFCLKKKNKKPITNPNTTTANSD